MEHAQTFDEWVATLDYALPLAEYIRLEKAWNDRYDDLVRVE
jgi:hypothetical protein